MPLPDTGPFQSPALMPPGKGPEGAVSGQDFLPQPPPATPPSGEAQVTAGVLTHPAPRPAQPLDTLTPGRTGAPGTAPHNRLSAWPLEQRHSSLRPRPGESQPQGDTQEALSSKASLPTKTPHSAGSFGAAGFSPARSRADGAG